MQNDSTVEKDQAEINPFLKAEPRTYKVKLKDDHEFTTEPKFTFPYKFYRKQATSSLKNEFTFLFHRNVVDQHQIGLMRGLISAYLLIDVITPEECEALSKLITTFDRSAQNHCSHIAAYFASICEVINA